MTLNKVKIGSLIEMITDTNNNLAFGKKDVMGMTITKEIIKTKAKINNTDLSKYIVIKPNEFVFNPRTHGKKIGLGFNNTKKTIIISWNNIGFRIKKEKKDEIIPDYLFINFNRDEWDREACFQSWGSSTEVFSWNSLCDMEIVLPSLKTQEKYVSVYNSMIENQKLYEKGLDDLKLTCDAYIENLKKENYKPIGNFIKRNLKKNKNEDFNKKEVKGFNNDGEFIKPMRLFSGDISSFKIISTNDFVYNSRINSTIKKLSIAMNDGEDLIVSPAYESFNVTKPKELYPFYLYMILQREIFAKKVLFNSFGSSTLVFGINDLGDIIIPVPDFKIQKSIAEIYMAYKNRWNINEKLKRQIKDICPILIKGSLEES